MTQAWVEFECKSYIIVEDGADSLPAYMYMYTHKTSSKHVSIIMVQVYITFHLPFITKTDFGVVAVLLKGYPLCSNINADTL